MGCGGLLLFKVPAITNKSQTDLPRTLILKNKAANSARKVLDQHYPTEIQAVYVILNFLVAVMKKVKKTGKIMLISFLFHLIQCRQNIITSRYNQY